MLSLHIFDSGKNPAHVAQLVEHVLGKDEVSGSIPLMGSMGAETNKDKGRTYRRRKEHGC